MRRAVRLETADSACYFRSERVQLAPPSVSDTAWRTQRIDAAEENYRLQCCSLGGSGGLLKKFAVVAFMHVT